MPLGAGGIPTVQNVLGFYCPGTFHVLPGVHEYSPRAGCPLQLKRPTFLGRNGRVPLDQSGHYSSQSFNSQGQRGYIQKKDILNVAFENPALNRCTIQHNFVRLDSFMRILPEEFFTISAISACGSCHRPGLLLMSLAASCIFECISAGFHIFLPDLQRVVRT